MASFEVTMRDGSVERVDSADAFQQEGQMTTFFRTADGRAIDSWSTRVARIRTNEVLMIRRDDAAPSLSLATSA